MPPYLEKEVDTIIKNLIAHGLKDEYWDFIKISEKNWVAVKKVLEQWSQPCTLSTKEMMNITRTDYIKHERDFYITCSTVFDIDSDIIKSYRSKRDDNRDFQFYKNNQFLLPDCIVLSKQEVSLLEASKESNLQLKDYIELTWKCNRTMVDYEYLALMGSEGNKGFDLIQTTESFCVKKISASENIYDLFVTVFHNIARSIKVLKEIKCFTIEPHIGDVFDELLKLKLKSNHNLKFDRVYLSNIADYTSLLYAFIECMPMLKHQKWSFIKSSIMLNNLFWDDMNEYAYSSTLMKSIEEIPSLINVSLVEGGVVGNDPLWKNSVEKFEPSISNRRNIIEWLTRILINYAFPSLRYSQKNKMKECYAPNMSAFFKAIKFLIDLGYPRHWFQAYLQTIEANNIVTLATHPHSCPNKYKINNIEQKLDLTSILLEFKIMATIYSPIFNIGNE